MKLNLKIVAATAAVAMMSSGAAHAADAVVTATPAQANYSLEGLQLLGGETSLPSINIAFGNNLTYQDDIIITVAGATPGTAPLNVTCNGTTLGFVQNLANGWNYRVTDQTGATIGDSCTFDGLNVTSASLATSAGTDIFYKATRFITGTQVDQGKTTNLVKVASQFKAAAGTPLNAIIDVFADREEFVDPDPTITADRLTFTLTTDNGLPTFTAGAYVSPFVDTTAATTTITGDFAWADWDKDGSCTDQLGSAFGLPAGLSIDAANSDCTKMTFISAVVGALPTTTYVVQFNIPGNKVVAATDYTGATVFKYKLNATVTNPANVTTTGSKALSWDPGAWTLNGAQVYIQYMPYGTNISRIIYVANKGASDADITVDAIDNNGNSYKFVGGVAKKGAVTELSGNIDSGLAAAGFTAGKVAITLTFTAPDTVIEVYSAYNVGGSDRGTVVNSSNGRSFFYGTGVNMNDFINN
jgi:hypothetical protein